MAKPVKTALRFGAVAVVPLILAIQFVPYGRDHANPPVLAEPKWDSPRTREIFFRACADCHSNETVWPWYSHVAPLSWALYNDVRRGRKEFNVSEWGRRKENGGDEAAETVGQGRMPPGIYAAAHPSARLSPGEQKEFIEGLYATFGGAERKDRPVKKPGIRKKIRWFLGI